MIMIYWEVKFFLPCPRGAQQDLFILLPYLGFALSLNRAFSRYMPSGIYSLAHADELLRVADTLEGPGMTWIGWYLQHY